MDYVPSIPNLNNLAFEEVMDVSTEQIKNYMKVLPAISRNVLGCSGCEWKGTKDCPLKKSDNPPRWGICAPRAYFIASLTGGKKVSHSELMRIYNTVVGQKTNMSDYREFIEKKQIYLEKLKDFRSKAKKMDEKTLKAEKSLLQGYREEYYAARANWYDLWKEVMKYTDKKLDRDSREQTVRELNSMSLSDIHRIMRGNVVDGEIK